MGKDGDDEFDKEVRAGPSAIMQYRKRWEDFRVATHDEALRCYKKYFVELVLRQKPLKPSEYGRQIPLIIDRDPNLIDERRGQPYITNAIRTSRYTVYDFVPKQLIFQFTRLANFYFLCVGIPQTIPGVSTTGNFTTILPLLFFVLLTIVKEGYDDFKRHRLDKVENANPATVIRRKSGDGSSFVSPRKWLASRWFPPSTTAGPGINIELHNDDDNADGEYGWKRIAWRNIKVGDVVKLGRDERVPADMVLLHASGDEGVAFFDTMDLDGETNLKTKEPLPDFKACGTIAGIRACRADFLLEDPNANLYQFDGQVTVNEKRWPLTSNEVVYRGSTLRNTERAIAMVINTGEECKIRLNSNQHPDAKKPALEKISNQIVIILVIYVICLTIGCSRGYKKWQISTERNAPYLNGADVLYDQIVIGYAIMFNNNIPLALYITLEITRIIQMLMLNGDLGMYDEATDTPAQCNTNTILENLGQVSYIFSDKTGTLTENVMKFRKMSVAGTAWLHEADIESEEPPVSRVPTKVSTAPRSSGYFNRQDTIDSQPETAESGGNPFDNIIELTPLSTHASPIATPTLPSPIPPSPSGRRSSSQWRSTGRPDHVQPELTTKDLLEYIRLKPASTFARRAQEYILSIALCHTCLPEVKDGTIDFQASSPDELALVRAAQELGYVVIQRSSQTVTLRVTTPNGGRKDEVYQILDVIEFSSKRKRMSIVVRFPDGRIFIICKGADSAILPRLKSASLASQKVSEVRKSADLEREMHRRSEQMEKRNSFGGRPSLTLRRSMGGPQSPVEIREPSREMSRLSVRPNVERSRSAGPMKNRPSEDEPRLSIGARTVNLGFLKTSSLPSPSLPLPSALNMAHAKFSYLDDPAILDEATVFSRCFKHLDDFATEGLRTLVIARKFISETEYKAWRKIYNEATTSLVDRQDMIEAAGEMIEQNFDLVGATAIEDKLQAGVPDTIDKLRRANIKIWMLTGDKRETAINIAHSARICQPASDIFILDASKGNNLETQIHGVLEDIKIGCVHSVVVIDGQTLAAVEQSRSLEDLFYTLIPRIDAVICCRASPAQKSLIVRAIRHRVPRALTLAIGDGANDLAMISASHVGVGISGKEGLQAARVADYAIAQFRFLQRLLLVHGRWNYVRTARFYLATFWKETFFYLPTAMYQRQNGYSGTSLYEMWSLTVLNFLFTSLCTICMGVWEQDLNADTLLAVPELYVHGQRNRELNIPRFLRWTLAAAAEGVVVWLGVWASYNVFGLPRDDGLFALGDLAFTICIIWINYKLMIIETHHKTAITLTCFGITIAGWFAWQGFLNSAYAQQPSPYAVRDGFSKTFGRDPLWWLTMLAVILVLLVVEIAYKAIQRRLVVAGLWRLPRALTAWTRVFSRDGDVVVGGGVDDGDGNAEDWHVEVWQELEKDPAVRVRLRKILDDEERGLGFSGANGDGGDGDGDGDRNDTIEEEDLDNRY